MKRTIILIAIVLTGCGGEPDRVDPAAAGDNARATSQAAVAQQVIEASLNAAGEYLQTRDLAKAEAILLRLLDRVPNEPHALEMHGQLLMAKAADARDRGNHAGARAHFEEAYERYAALTHLQPNSAGLQQSAGEVAQVAGRNDDALLHYQKARQLNPDDAKPHFFAAQIHIQRGEHDDAAAALQQVLAIDPDEPLAHASLANIAVQQEQYDDALDHIAEARDIRPGDVSLRVIEASIHRKRGEPQVAVELLVALSPQHRSTWFVTEELAAAYSALGELGRVAEVWALSHRSHPRDPRSYLAAVRAGEALLKAGQRDQARLWLEQARLDAPDAEETEAFAQAFRAERSGTP